MNTKLRLLAFVTVISSSQLSGQFHFSPGVKAGIARSTITRTNVPPGPVFEHLDEPIFEPMIGVYASFIEWGFMEGQVELLYLRKGGSKKFNIMVYSFEDPSTPIPGTSTAEFGLQYLVAAVNIIPKFSFETFTVHVTIGPTFNYLVKATNLTSFQDRLTSFQIGYIGGVGFSSTSAPVFIELRYTADFEYFYRAGTGNFWNRTWLLNIGTTI